MGDNYVHEWHVSVIVPVLVRGGTEEEALQAAVDHVGSKLPRNCGLDADYWLTKDIGKVMESENLDDAAIDIHLPTQTVSESSGVDFS